MISMIDGLPAAGRPALPFAGSPGLNFSEDFKCLNGVVHKTRPIRFVKRCQQWAQSIHQALCDQITGTKRLKSPVICARLLLGGRNRWALFRKHG